MGNFQTAYLQVLDDERGFVNHPLDRGGPTNLGITLKTWERYHGRPGAIEDIQALTPDTAAPIYRKVFWDELDLDEIPDALALVIFNQAVLRGAPAAVRSLQAALGLRIDGILGPKSVAAIRIADQKKLMFEFLRNSHADLLTLSINSPDQAAFIRGWSNRIFDLISKNLFDA